MNMAIIILTGVLLILLVVFLIKRNQLDKKEYEKQVNQDYPHSTQSPGDVNTEDPMH